MPKNKRNWDKIRTQSNADSARYRDVYEDQQLDRKRIEKPQTMTSRTILAIVAGLAVAAGLWLLVGAVEMTGALDGVNAGWKKTFFSKDGVDSPYQYVTLREATPKFEEDGVTPVLDESGEQAYDYAYTKYIWYSETGILTDIQNSKWPSYTACEQAWIDDDGKVQYGILPEKDEDGNKVYPEGYLEAVEAKKAALEAMDVKPRMFLVLEAPDGLEAHPDFLGKVEGHGFVFRSTAAQAGIDYDGKYHSGDETMLGAGFDVQDPVAISEYGFEPGKNANLYMRLNRGKPQDTADSMFHDSFFDLRPTPVKLFLSLMGFMAMFGILYMVLKKNLAAMNILSDTSDINQHFNDQHIALPEEVQSLYDIFPDVGAHSSVMVSSMISHQAITNKGLKKVRLAKRADKDILDEDGDVEVYKGDILRDEHGEPITVEVPLIDTKFTEVLFDSSKVPNDKETRKYYDAPAIPYNPGDANLDKLKGYNTVAELINGDWEFPVYEPQRPGGVYIVDTAPVNTMVLAITRAGKGQTIIEPTIDMWTRESRPNNMVINDPKGELLVKNYVRGTVRGFTIVQFNLINPMKTDIYNPLALAAEAARDGNSTKCAMYVENIAEVFFPVDGGEDPLWPNAANNAFKRAAYGLIDYYLEEEKEMRRIASVKNTDKKVLEQKIDDMWGRVTLYNCYQLFVQMSSKKQLDPAHVVDDKIKQAEADGHPLTDEQKEQEAIGAMERMPVWQGAKEADTLTLFFNATSMLPKNSMRTLVTNADNALKAMGGAEKMLASCDLLHIEKMCQAS